jgi:hypothetical protein
MKKIAVFSVLFLSFTLNFIFAQQSGCFIRLDSIEFGVAEAIISNSVNEYFVTGRSGDSSYYNGGSPIINKHGGVFVAKFDQSHNILWLKNQESDSYFNYSNSIAVDSKGNVIIGGWYYNYIIFGKDSLSSNNGSSNNAYISKFRSDGTHLWSKRVHTPNLFSDGQITSLSTDGLGNIYFGGIFGGSMIFGQDSIQTWGSGDNYWGKMDSTGNIQWIKAAGSGATEIGVNVSADSIGNLYVLGSVNNSYDSTYIDTILNFNGIGFIAKYSPSGQMKWLKSAELGEFYMGKRTTDSKILTKNGVIIVASTMYNRDSNIVSIAGAQTSINPNSSPAFVLKMDTAGNGLWIKNTIWTSLVTDVMGVAIKSNGDIALTTHNGDYIEADTLIRNYSSPVYLTLDGNSGQILDYCYPAQPGTGAFYSRDITLLNDTILTTGFFDREPNGHRRIFIAKVGLNTVGVENYDLAPQSVALYPNPTNNGRFTLDVSNTEGVEFNRLTISNVNGQLMHFQKLERKTNYNKIELQLNEFSKGIYFLSLQHSKGRITKKLIVH